MVSVVVEKKKHPQGVGVFFFGRPSHLNWRTCIALVQQIYDSLVVGTLV